MKKLNIYLIIFLISNISLVISMERKETIKVDGDNIEVYPVSLSTNQTASSEEKEEKYEPFQIESNSRRYRCCKSICLLATAGLSGLLVGGVLAWASNGFILPF